MTTQTQKLLAAIMARGFKPYESKSNRACYSGKAASGRTIYVWPDKTGGARYSTDPCITTAIPVSSTTIQRLLDGEQSNLIPLLASATPPADLKPAA